MEGLGNKKFHENHALILYYLNAGVKALATYSSCDEPATLCQTLYAREHYQASQIDNSAISEGFIKRPAQLAGVIDQPIINGRLGSLLASYSRDGWNNAATIP